MNFTEAPRCYSPLQSARRGVQNSLPQIFMSPSLISVEEQRGEGEVDNEDIRSAFPNTYGLPRVLLKRGDGGGDGKHKEAMRVGVCLSGGQAAGGHNVIAGVWDFIKRVHEDSILIGFLDGPHGIYSSNYVSLDANKIDEFRNSGGFDMIGSGRHKIEKPEEFASSLACCVALDLDGLVIIGGDDSNTNAAQLAEYFAKNSCKTKVCGAPKTIDGDLKKLPYIPISFGFDSACRTYSELIGNLGQVSINDDLTKTK